jgi:basic membrane protein A
MRAAGILAATALVVTACGGSASMHRAAPSASASRATPRASVTACLAADIGGINDRSFNAASWQGIQQMSGNGVTGAYLQSTSDSQYVPAINALTERRCGIIVTVASLMGEATRAAASAHPGQKFAIVDYRLDPPLPNVDALVFDTAQDGFLGGYLAGGMSKTGTVATFGGLKVPTVTIYMDGFWDGVQYYNRRHHAHVQVLGWNEQTQAGMFTGDFIDPVKGQLLAKSFITSGADIIFPVAGDANFGAAKAVQQASASGRSVSMEWADTDGCTSAPGYCRYMITSVQKGIQAAVKAAVLSVANGTFKGGTYIGTLANGGVSLAPYHDFASQVPASLRAELAQVTAGIGNGTIQTPTGSPV